MNLKEGREGSALEVVANDASGNDLTCETDISHVFSRRIP